MLTCIAAAWKIIKGWLPAAGVKKIRFLTKATMGEYVDDQNRFEVSKHAINQCYGNRGKNRNFLL
jgi:hypothetical protein